MSSILQVSCGLLACCPALACSTYLLYESAIEKRSICVQAGQRNSTSRDSLLNIVHYLILYYLPTHLIRLFFFRYSELLGFGSMYFILQNYKVQAILTQLFRYFRNLRGCIVYCLCYLQLLYKYGHIQYLYAAMFSKASILLMVIK